VPTAVEQLPVQMLQGSVPKENLLIREQSVQVLVVVSMEKPGMHWLHLPVVETQVPAVVEQ